MSDTVQMSDPVAERAYVSALLADPTVSQRCRAEPATLTVEALRSVLMAAYSLERQNGNWSLSSLEEALCRAGALASIGGVDTLRELVQTADFRIATDPKPTVTRILELAKRREEYETSRAVTDAILSGHTERANTLIQKLTELKAGSSREVEILTAQETTEAAYHYLVDFAENKRHIALGIPVFDRVIGRVTPGSMTIIGGSTSAGKSQTMLLSAMNMSASGNHPGIISLEDAREEWGGRIIARLTGITFRDFAAARGVGKDERSRVYFRASEAVDAAGKHAFDIAYAISADLDAVLSAARRLVFERGCNVLFVDYIQAVRIGSEWNRRIDKGFADVAKRLKGFAARTKVPLIIGSQLARSDDAPTIHSLKETGDLENEAEIVILLWRTAKSESRWKIGKVKWASERPKGVITFNQSTGMIESFDEEAEDEFQSKNLFGRKFGD